MNSNERIHRIETAKWLASRFDGTLSASIRLDLFNGRIIDGNYLPISDDIIQKLARRYRNKLNSFCFGNAARRNGKELVITAAHHSIPQHHLHIQVGMSDRICLKKLKSFTEAFCLKNSWVASSPYVAETCSDIAAQLYPPFARWRRSAMDG